MPAPKLPKYLSRLQKNARNKEYRLRRKGADQSGLADVSPRLDARTVAAMDAREQRAYAARLRRFVSRDNQIRVYENGVAVPERVARTIEERERQYNALTQRRIERMDAMIAGTPIQERFGTVRERLEQQAERTALSHNGQRIGAAAITGQLVEVHVQTPESRTQAEKRAKMLTEMTRKEAPADRRRRVRRTVEQMLYMMGDVPLARRVRNLSNDQFDVLTTVTDFMGLLTVEFASEQYTEAEIRRSPAEWAEIYREQATSDVMGPAVTYGNQAAMNDLIDLVRANV